jgi:hypothetical protein
VTRDPTNWPDIASLLNSIVSTPVREVNDALIAELSGPITEARLREIEEEYDDE